MPGAATGLHSTKSPTATAAVTDPTWSYPRLCWFGSLGSDPRERKFIWPDAKLRDLEQSGQRIQKQYSDFPRDQIEEFLIDWIDMGYAPEHYSQAQLDELDRLTERWVADHLRRAKTAKKR